MIHYRITHTTTYAYADRSSSSALVPLKPTKDTAPMLLLMLIGIGLAALSLRDRDLPAQITTAFGLTVFVLVYAINRSGRVQFAMIILLIGGTCVTMIGALIAQRPIPMLFFLA